MILYLDASALVKLFREEPGSETVRKAVRQAVRSYTHSITYPEARSALARLSGEKRLGVEASAEIKADLEATWLELGIVTPEEPLLRRAGDLAERFALRGFDSVHLAAAEALWNEVEPKADFRFAVFDRSLRAAATELGIEILD